MQTKSVFLECPICKTAIKGLAYACSECATMYCISCTVKRAKCNEPCPKCAKPLQLG